MDLKLRTNVSVKFKEEHGDGHATSAVITWTEPDGSTAKGTFVFLAWLEAPDFIQADIDRMVKPFITGRRRRTVTTVAPPRRLAKTQ